MAIQLGKIRDVVQSSVLSKGKNEAYQEILDASTMNGMDVIDIQRAKIWIKNEVKQNAKLLRLVTDGFKAAEHEASIARIVEKDGFATVSAFEGTAEFNSEFKRHLEYVRREAKKSSSAAKVPYHSAQTIRASHLKSKGRDRRTLPFNANSMPGRQYTSGFKPYFGQLRPKPGPSAARPCNICKGPDHWAEHCPNRAKYAPVRL